MTGELNVTLQIAFAERLREIEAMHLQAALAVAVGEAGVSAIDNELGQVVDAAALTVVAQAGLRGEVFFAVPVLLQSAPPRIAMHPGRHNSSSSRGSSTLRTANGDVFAMN